MREFIDLTKVLNTGDKVWCSNCGWKPIDGITAGLYPITCDERHFTRDGRNHVDDRYPTLFLDEQSPNFTYEPEHEIKINWSKVTKNTKVIVSNNFDFYSVRVRYFSDYLKSAPAKFNCYGNGADSDAAKDTTQWKYCKIHPDVEIKKEWLK